MGIELHPKMRPRDKYGFKTLLVGEEKMLFGVKPMHAQMTYYRYCERYPDMVHRDFEWEAIKGGVVVRRTR